MLLYLYRKVEKEAVVVVVTREWYHILSMGFLEGLRAKEGRWWFQRWWW